MDRKPLKIRIIADSTTPSQPWFLYLLRTGNGSLYTGISTEPQRRLRQHQGELAGGAKALRGKGPLQLVWQQAMPDRARASQAEYQLKQLTKQQKEQLVQGLWRPDWLTEQPDR